MASINIYLKNKASDIPGFRISGPNTQDHPTLGIKIQNKNDRWFFKSSSLNEPVPKVFDKFVEEISYHDSFNSVPVRERGIYRFGTAEAILNINFNASNSCYKIEIQAKNLVDIQGLDRRIKVGTIRPEESFEGAQIGMSKAELEEELIKAQEACKITSRTNTALLISEKALKNQRERVVKELTEAESTWKFWQVRDMILSTLHRMAEEKITKDERK